MKPVCNPHCSLKTNRKKLFLAMLAASPLLIAQGVQAGPKGGDVRRGDGLIEYGDQDTRITQQSDRMVVDWDSYDLDKDQSVTYLQPGADAIALNRILDSKGSEIHGQINANGRVVLVNPHGVLFSKDARVNVGGLIASGLAINPDDFMNGDLTFTSMEGADGTVVNQGVINAATGGSVGLLGKAVKNEGLISARLGSVSLAAGKEAVVTFDAAGLMGVRVSEEILQEDLGLDTAVLNEGSIKAQGGRILLTASTSRDIFSQAVNTGDLEQATSVVTHEDGSFTLGGGADTVNTGTLDVSSSGRGAGDIVLLGENVTQEGALRANTDAGTAGSIELHARQTAQLTDDSITSAKAFGRGSGGEVKILGHHVGLFDQAKLDVSGAWGGGNAYIGGDFQGKNPLLPSADRTVVGPEAEIMADALSDGDGGRVIVWADKFTQFHGNLSARGVGNGGGGFSEVSGKETLSFSGYADLSGAGHSGSLLLDPENIDIVRGEGGITDDVDFEDPENSIISPSSIKEFFYDEDNNDANLTLQATKNIKIIDSVQVSDAGRNSTFTLQAGNKIDIQAQIDMGEGKIDFFAGSDGCGDACLGASGERDLILGSGASLISSGKIKLRAADGIKIDGTIGSESRKPHAVILKAGNEIVINDFIQVESGFDETDEKSRISLVAGDDSLRSNASTDGSGDESADSADGVADVDPNLTISGNLFSNGSNIELNAAGTISLKATARTAGGHFLVGKKNDDRPIGFSSNFSNDADPVTINTGTENIEDLGLEAGEIKIYTREIEENEDSGNVDLGAINLNLNYEKIDGRGDYNEHQAESIGAVYVEAEGDITFHEDWNFNNTGPRKWDGSIPSDGSSNDLGDEPITLSLKADGDITIDGEINDEYADGRDALDVTLSAGGSVTVNKEILTAGGNITLSGANVFLNDRIDTRHSNFDGGDGAQQVGGGEADDETWGQGEHVGSGWSTGGHVSIEATNEVKLDRVVTAIDCGYVADCAGNLTIRADEGTSPTITQTGALDIAGVTELDLGNGNATLENSDNTFHDDLTIVSAEEVSITADSDLVLGSVTFQETETEDSAATGDLKLKVTGDVTEAGGSIHVPGTFTLEATGQIDLNDNDLKHRINTLVVKDASSVALANSANLTLNSFGVQSGGSIDITTKGNLTATENMSTEGRDGAGGAVTLEAEGGTLSVQGIYASGDSGTGDNAGHNGGDISLTGNTIRLNGELKSIGGSGGDGGPFGDSQPDGNGGNIQLNGSTYLVSDIKITTTGEYAGSFTVGGTLDSAADTNHNSLTVNSGKVLFESSVGGEKAVGNLEVTSNRFLVDEVESAPFIRIDGNVKAVGAGSSDDTSDSGTEADPQVTLKLDGDKDGKVILSHNQVLGTERVALIGGGEGDHSFKAPGFAAKWKIKDDNQESTLSPTSEDKSNEIVFSGFQNLIGGADKDTFKVINQSVSISIDGGGGENSLQSYGGEGSDNTWDLSSQKQKQLTNNDQAITFTGIQEFIGSGEDQLTGPNSNNTWTIDSKNGGVLEEAVNVEVETPSYSYTFSGMKFLAAGKANDEFVFVGEQGSVGTIEGNKSTDSQDFIVARNGNNRWVLDNNNQGSLGVLPEDFDNSADKAPAPYLSKFSDLDVLQGGSGDDLFLVQTGASFDGLIDGGGGERNELTFEDSESEITVAIDTENPDWNFQNIQRLTGNSDSSLTIASGDNEWTIDDAGSGEVTQTSENPIWEGALEFSAFSELIGGSGTDVFEVQAGASFDGLIDGGGGERNELTFEDSESEITVAIGTENPDWNFQNIQRLTGNSDSSLTIASGDNEWTIDDAGSGEVTQTSENPIWEGALEFSAFSDLIGGSGDDVFVIEEGGSVTGKLDGGGGEKNSLTDKRSGNSWRLSGFHSGTLENGDDEAIARFQNIQIAKGGSDASLYGPNKNNQWNLDDKGVWTLQEQSISPEGDVSDEVLTFSGMNSLVGDSKSDHFIIAGGQAFDGSLAGGDGENHLTVRSGSDETSEWKIEYVDKGEVTNRVASFTSIKNLTGGEGADEFTLDTSGVVTGKIVGAGGSNSLTAVDGGNDWNLTGLRGGTLSRDENTIARFENIHTVHGGSGKDRFISPAFVEEKGNIWTLTGSDAGKLTIDENDLSFTGMETLEGNAGNDHFAISLSDDAVVFSGRLIGKGGDKNQVSVDSGSHEWTMTGSHKGTLNDVTNFEQIHSLQGAGEDQLTGPKANNNWSVTGAGSGTLKQGEDTDTEVSFAGMATLKGNGKNDIFTFQDDLTLSQVRHFQDLNGGEGINTVNANDLSFDLFFSIGSNTDADLSVSGMNHINANADQKNTLSMAHEGSYHWTLNGHSGSVIQTGETETKTNFVGFHKIIGGDGDDTFAVKAPSGDIDGGSGTNLVDYSISEEDVEVQVVGNGLDSESTHNISNIQGVIGNSDQGHASTIKVHAEATGDYRWVIEALDIEGAEDGVNDGRFNAGEAGEVYFVNFNHLVGGQGNDGFEFDGKGKITGSINGKGGTNEVLAEDASIGHTFRLDGTGLGTYAQNIQTFTANSEQANHLIAGNQENTWKVTGAGTGSLNDAVKFYGFSSLVGNEGRDKFVFSDDGSAQTIDGGAHPEGQVDSADFTDLSTDWTVGLGDKTEADLNVLDIEFLEANTEFNYVLAGDNRQNNWVIDEADQGTLNETVDFTGFKELFGNNGQDTFAIVGQGAVSGTIAGGQGKDTLDLTEITEGRKLTITIRDRQQEDDLALQGIENITARTGAQHHLKGADTESQWSITGTNAGSVGELFFTGMANLSGGALDDTFLFSVDGEISGQIDGGDSEEGNILDYIKVSEVDVTWGGATGFINIDHLKGNNYDTKLRIDSGTNQWFLTEGTNAGVVNDKLRFTGVNNLFGGSGSDTFTFSGGTLTGTLDTGAGKDQVNLTLSKGRSGSLNVVGGEGDNQIKVSGGQGNFQGRYRMDLNGKESLSYSGPNNAEYDLTYVGVSRLDDQVYAEDLTFVSDAEGREITLSGSQFVVPAHSKFVFKNKQNVTIEGTSQNHLSLSGQFSVPGRLTLQNAAVTQSDASAGIKAERLVLQDVSGFGSSSQPIRTQIDTFEASLGRTNVYLSDQGSLRLGDISSRGLLDLSSESGLTGSGVISTSGSVDIESGQGGIRLNNNNRITGRVSLVAADKVRFKNTRATQLGDVRASEFSLVTNDDVVGQGSVTADFFSISTNGNARFEHPDNRIGTLDVVSADNVSLNNNRFLEVSEISSRGTIDLSSNGLRVSGPVEASALTFDAGKDEALIEGLLNATGGISLRGTGIHVEKSIAGDEIDLDGRHGDLTLNGQIESNRRGISLGGHSVAQNDDIISEADLVVNILGHYSQDSNLISGGIQRLTAEGDITMARRTKSRSDAGQIHYDSGGNVHLSQLLANEGEVSVRAGNGRITGAGGNPSITASRLSLAANRGIGSHSESPLITDVETLHATNRTGEVNLTNTGGLHIDRLANNGNIRLRTLTGNVVLDNQAGSVFQTDEDDSRFAGGRANANYEQGVVSITVDKGSLIATGYADALNPDIVGREAAISVEHDIGSANRPLVLYVQDYLFTRGGRTWPMVWGHDQSPRNVEDQSDISLDMLAFLQTSGEQMVELESLEDIDPAIFTEIRNFTYSDISILLPEDQRYDEDL